MKLPGWFQPPRKTNRHARKQRLPFAVVALLVSLLLSSASVRSEESTAEISFQTGLEAPLPIQTIPLHTRVFNSLWSLPVLYENLENPFLQRIAAVGRYHGQGWGLNSDDGSASGWQNRRVRIGGAAVFLEHFQAGIQFNLNFDGANTGRFVKDIEDFYFRWWPDKRFRFNAGLFKVPVTNEWRTSSNWIVTVERSLFINQAVPGMLGGVLVEGTVGDVLYGAGVYSGSRSEDWRYPTLSGGAMIYGGLGLQFGANQSLRFDTAVQTPSPGNNATRPYDWIGALSYSGRFMEDRLWIQSDLVSALGQPGAGNLFGWIFLPSFDLTDQIQLVFRYQFLTSNQSNGIQLQPRYERRAPDLPTTRGNHYQAVYAGLNYYLYRDFMKVMGGMEYSRMDLAGGNGSFHGLTLFGAFRVWF